MLWTLSQTTAIGKIRGQVLKQLWQGAGGGMIDSAIQAGSFHIRIGLEFSDSQKVNGVCEWGK
jgi:hypothetical protein